MALESSDTSHYAVESLSSEISAKHTQYRVLIKRLLFEQSDPQAVDGVLSVPIFDEEQDQYLVLTYGWRGQERIYWVTIHLEIREGKVWIQRNQTELDLEAELMTLGVAQVDLVRALVPPQYRQLAGLNG